MFIYELNTQLVSALWPSVKFCWKTLLMLQNPALLSEVLTQVQKWAKTIMFNLHVHSRSMCYKYIWCDVFCLLFWWREPKVKFHLTTHKYLFITATVLSVTGLVVFRPHCTISSCWTNNVKHTLSLSFSHCPYWLPPSNTILF